MCPYSSEGALNKQINHLCIVTMKNHLRNNSRMQPGGLRHSTNADEWVHYCEDLLDLFKRFKNKETAGNESLNK
jgi:hypothetical protein